MRMALAPTLMLRFPEVWLRRPRARRSRPHETSCRRACATPASWLAPAAWSGCTRVHRPVEEEVYGSCAVDGVVGGDGQGNWLPVGGGLVGSMGNLESPTAVWAEGPEGRTSPGDRTHEIVEQVRRELSATWRNLMNHGGLARC